MTPSQRRFTAWAAICTVALVAFCVYESIKGAIEWWMTLVFILLSLLALFLRYAWWMMIIEERERKNAAKKSAKIPI